jgi:hypothetical protein
VRLYSKSGGEYSSKLPGMRKAFVELPTDSAILDGELCLIDPGGGANFYRLMTQMRTRWPEERLLVFLAFDLLHQAGSICVAHRYRSGSATSTDCADSRIRLSSNRWRLFPTARPSSTIATNSDLRASFPSAGGRATPAA